VHRVKGRRLGGERGRGEDQLRQNLRILSAVVAFFGERSRRPGGVSVQENGRGKERRGRGFIGAVFLGEGARVGTATRDRQPGKRHARLGLCPEEDGEADGWGHPVSENGRAAAYPFGEEGSWVVRHFPAQAGFGPAASLPFFCSF
jgi:hypothetical protein